MVVNKIITNGSNTISIKLYFHLHGIDIRINNDIKILKSFWLKLNTFKNTSNWNNKNI